LRPGGAIEQAVREARAEIAKVCLEMARQDRRAAGWQTMMTDAEVADQIARAGRFIADVREMIAEAVIDPCSPCADARRRGLQRIAATLDAVPFATLCNLANLDAALRLGVLDLAVGAGPTLDFEDATAFLATLDRRPSDRLINRPNGMLNCGDPAGRRSDLHTSLE
jgi:hypothetical protein